MKRQRAGGFTLIELLVVIAIIAILAAILFPVFARAREKARQAQCQSNVKNLALAIRMYSQDYDERLPSGIPAGAIAPCGPGGWCNGAAAGSNLCTQVYSCGYAYASQPYIKSDQILLCPNWNKVQWVRQVGFPVQPPGVNNWWLTTYVLSVSLTGASEAEITIPSNKVMLYDVYPYHHDGQVSNGNNSHIMDFNNPKPSMLEIVAFADGHSKIMNMNQAWGPFTFQCGAVPNNVNKWNMGSGWSIQNPPDCNKDPSPGSITGRQGGNF